MITEEPEKYADSTDLSLKADNKTKNVLLNRTKMHQNQAMFRTPMGEYICEGGKTLTQLAIPLPGAADYSPSTSLTKPSAPQFSIVGKPKPLPTNDFPGPNEFKTENNMVWRHRGFPLIGRHKSARLPSCSLGPAAYMLNQDPVKTGSSKWTMAGRPTIMHGPPDCTVQPVDTHGPAEYSVIQQDGSGPAYSLSKRLEISTVFNTPGPGSYNIGTTIGKAVAKSISSRQPQVSNVWAPSPNTYGVQSQIGDGPKHSMTYRSFERKASPSPSPANFKPSLNTLKKSPDYSCRKVCRPIYPDVLNYAEHSVMKNHIVGPGTYDHHKDFSNNDAPGFTMGVLIKRKSEETPGPASYSIKQKSRPDAKRVPAWSMGVRIETKRSTYGPGPAAYYPQSNTTAPKYSMSGRNKLEKTSTTPAPNQYSIRSGQTKHGVSKGPNPTLKGRPSPFLYSGFRKITV